MRGFVQKNGEKAVTFNLKYLRNEASKEETKKRQFRFGAQPTTNQKTNKKNQLTRKVNFEKIVTT